MHTSRALARVRALKDAVLDVVWPPSCAVCGPGRAVDGSTDGLCRACAARLWLAPAEQQCPVCAASAVLLDAGTGRCLDCIGRHAPWTALHALGSFAGTLRELICALKYRGETAAARPLARLLASSERRRAALVPGPVVDAVVPVPLAPKRLAERGFNQAAWIASELTGERLDHLLRRRDGEAQVGRGGAERRRLDQASFTTAPGLLGRSVLLVDDVVTTGATLRAASRALLAGGARRVRCLVAARTPPPGEGRPMKGGPDESGPRVES